ncbi:Protein R03G8.3, partial [Aphelenchoides avenae]
MKNCKRTYEQITSIRRGYVVLNATYAIHGISCEFRCCYPKNDYELTFGEWTDIAEAAPDCDVVEVRCSNMRGEVFYEYLHAQVYRKNGPENPRPLDTQSAARPPVRVFPQSNHTDLKATVERRAPDVHIILFDSVSQPQFYRSMPRTVHVLREEMGAVPFNFVNKVGLNSRPNGYALLLGKQAYTMDASPLNEARVPIKNMDAFCRTPMDNESFIGYEFQKAGYKTMMSEDWALGVFNWPDCFGFAKPPVDHYMR